MVCFVFRYTETYKPFNYLLCDEADKFVKKFISRERPLTDYVTQIKKLKQMEDEVASMPVEVPMHLFLLDCHNINQVSDSYTCLNEAKYAIHTCLNVGVKSSFTCFLI